MQDGAEPREHVDIQTGYSVVAVIVDLCALHFGSVAQLVLAEARVLKQIVQLDPDGSVFLHKRYPKHFALTFVFLFAFYMMNGISSFFSETAMSTCVTFGILIIALSLMIYSMIKNAVISGAVCVIGEVALVIVYVVKSSVFEGGIQKVLEVFNLSSHFENFTNSIFDVTGVLYFLSVIAICIFLTMQTILKRRWN